MNSLLKVDTNDVFLFVFFLATIVSNKVVCPNFGHTALTSSLTKYKFLQMKNSFATIVNESSVLKLFQLSTVSNRVVCPYFEHTALTSSFTKYKFLQMKDSFVTYVNELSKASTKYVNLEVRAGCPKLGHPTLRCGLQE